MKVSDYIVSYLEEKGIHVIFGYIGGMITHLVDSIDKNPNMQFIQTYHEQTAAIGAEGYAIESGKFGVAISTSGPGATNMITGIADAFFDSIPVLYITGQVNTYEYKYDKPIRQQGFQEIDIVSVVKPITKYVKFIDNAEDIKYELDKALFIALSGRKGPVLLDLPMDIQRADVDPNVLSGYKQETSEVVNLSQEKWNQVETLLSESKRPILLLGGGCRGINSTLLDKFVKKFKFPVITSLLGRGIINEEYENYIGMLGSYGNRCVNMSIPNADLLIALGSRLDTRQTGAMIDSFLPDGKIIHVDIDENELINHRLNNRISLHCTVEYFLEKMIEVTIALKDYSLWNQFVLKLKKKYNQDNEIERFVENKSPYHFIQFLNKITKESDIICADIGQNQMWAAQTLKLKKEQSFITSGGLAPMGFSIPIAIGCSFANLSKSVYSINGDGGFHISLQALMLISQYNLPIRVVVLNNKSLGMITQFQHLYFSASMPATVQNGGYCVPSIREIADAYSLTYIYLEESLLDNKEIKEQIESVRNCIIEYDIKGLTTVSPKLEYNKPISMPLPELSEEEYIKNMRFLKM